MKLADMTLNLDDHRHTFELPQGSISYVDIGEGPVLLLGHSFLWDSDMWWPQIASLSQHYRCIVPDLWGHGLSTTLPKETQNLTDIAREYLLLMDNLNVEHFSVIGLSVGGMWGAELALLAPKRVKTLAMLGCFIGFEPEVSRNKYNQMLDTMSMLQHIPNEMVEQIAPLFFADNCQTQNPQLFDSFKSHLLNYPTESIESVERLGKMIFGRRDLMEDSDKLTLPCLIMNGTEDKPRPIIEGYLMHDAIDGSEFVHIADAGHISTLEQSQFVSQQLHNFLSKYLA
ncbi:alpha/beta fold hydrolase [Shewanella waksmanii]|uniref:alpha/beta fold hydrolase n=1 Tax=Shewanella waksmanii TaxID=213783 RepID=UPI00373678C2